MDWIDISVPLRNNMQVFTGDPPFHIERVQTIAGGGVCNLSTMQLGAHSGTHVDAPIHFLEGGAGAQDVPLDALMGPAWVVDAARPAARSRREDVDRFDDPRGETRLLFRTPAVGLWDEPEFDAAFVAPDASAAEGSWRAASGWSGWTTCRSRRSTPRSRRHRILLGGGV
jgi:arylformamidase